MRKFLICLMMTALFASTAHSDFTGKDASGATITFKNSGACTSVVCVAQFQPVDSTGAAFGVTGNPFFISFGTGVTLPAYAATPTFNLGTLNGAATAANQPTNAAIGSTTSGQTGQITMGAVTTSSPSYSAATTNPLSLSTVGNLRIEVAANSIAGGLQVQAATGNFASGSLASGAVVDLTNLSTPIAAGGATATKGILLGGQFDSTQKTLTNGQQAAVSMSQRGAVYVATGAETLTTTISGTPNYNLSQVGASSVSTATTGVQKVGIVGNAGGAVDAATAAAVPANAVYTGVNVGGNLTGLVGDPCQTVARSYVPVNISTATTTRIIAPTASKKTYICGMFLVSAGTNNVGVVEGTGGTCGTATAGVIGGTTAATGPNLTAQVGFVLPNTGYAQAATVGTNVDFCLITSAAIQLTGHVVYVQF